MGDEVSQTSGLLLSRPMSSPIWIKPEEDIDIAHWLSWPEQKLLEFTSGKFSMMAWASEYPYGKDYYSGCVVVSDGGSVDAAVPRGALRTPVN